MQKSALGEEAGKIIVKAMRRTRSRAAIAMTYGIPPEIVACYLENKDCGTLYAREVIRAEIGRQQAAREGKDFRLTRNDRYKGTR